MKKIFTAEEFSKKADEALNSPIDIRWVKTTENWVGLFHTPTKEYRITISKVDQDIWKFKYTIRKDDGKLTYKLSGLNYDVFKVLSTINSAMHYFITTQNPNGIIFAASGDSEGRIKLYDKFCADCVKKYNYTLYVKGYNEDDSKEACPTLFLLYDNNKIDTVVAHEVVIKVIGDMYGEIDD